VASSHFLRRNMALAALRIVRLEKVKLYLCRNYVGLREQKKQKKEGNCKMRGLIICNLQEITF